MHVMWMHHWCTRLIRDKYMGIAEVFSNELYNGEDFYKYFSKREILNIPVELCNLMDMDKKTENKYIFSNIVNFFCDLYVTLNVNNSDFIFIDSKLDDIKFWDKFSDYLYSDYLTKKEGAILVFAKVRKNCSCQHLEKAFESNYYKNNPILASRCIKELSYLKSNKSEVYEKLLLNEIDIINFITLLLLQDENTSKKIIDLYKNEKWIDNIQNNAVKLCEEFETFITNIQNVNKLKDFTRDEYITSFSFFIKENHFFEIKDFFSFYKKIFQKMKINT